MKTAIANNAQLTGYHKFTPSEGKMESIKPVRVQRSRRHKMESPNGLSIVCVTRPSRWGNCFRLDSYTPDRDECVEAFKEKLRRDKYDNPKWFEDYYLKPIRGKNLACWCGLSEKCHADIWLQLANGDIE